MDNQNNKTVSKLCSKLPIKILKRRHWRLMNNRLISYNCTKIQTPIVQNKYKQKIQTLSGNYDVSAFPKKVNDINHLLFLQRKLHHRQLPGSYIYLNNKSSNILKSYLIHRMLLLLIACIAIQTISNDTVSSYHWLL